MLRSYKEAGLLDAGKSLGFENFVDVVRNQVGDGTCVLSVFPGRLKLLVEIRQSMS